MRVHPVPERPDGDPESMIPDVVRAACENARALAKICDVLEAGPARVPLELELKDGAFILPEEV